jgi:hypothetical protein
MNNGRLPNKAPAPPPNVAPPEVKWQPAKPPVIQGQGNAARPTVIQGQGNATGPPVVQGQGNAARPPVIQGQGNAVNVTNPGNQAGGGAARPPVIQGQGNAGAVPNPLNPVGGAAARAPVIQGQGNAGNIPNPINQVGGAAVRPIPIIQGQGNAGNIANPVNPIGGAAAGAPVIQGQGKAGNFPNPVNPVGGAVARPPVIQEQGNAGNITNPVNPVGGAAGGPDGGALPNVGPTPLSPEKPRGFESWQWTRVTAGVMSSARAGQALTGNSYMLSTTIGNGELYAAKSTGPGNALWRFIIPGDRAQFALSFEAPKDSPGATLVLPDWGETNTVRTPTWSVRFGKQPFHTFGWAAPTAPAVARPADLPPISFIELDNSIQALFNVTAQFPNPRPPVICWQLWHLRRPNDPQPLGDQNPATNGCDEYKKAVGRQAAMIRGATRPNQLLDGRRGQLPDEESDETTDRSFYEQLDPIYAHHDQV